MDQIKEILRQAIKYRFWIAVGISALLPMIAYAVGSGPIKQQAATKTEEINSAEKGVEAYGNGTKPNHQYKGIVDAQKTVLSKDVNTSWEMLYNRQAPLLTWPETVEKEFKAWGNKWPENVDNSTVRVAVINYVTEYPKVVTEVYNSFRPFNILEGTGVVSAPDEALLLKPSPLMKLEGSEVPALGKVWAAQERLWIQRSLLQVVNEVNHAAKDWDTAKIKQITLFDVGTRASQDQISMAEGIKLAEAPPLDPPGAAAAPAAPAEGVDPAMGPGMMGGMGTQEAADAVFYIQTDSVQYKIMPFQLSVLIDQSNIQELLVALENSPMAIQVSEFAIARPNQRVIKPVKGDSMMWGGDPSMMYGNRMMSSSMGMTAFGGGMGMGMMPGGMSSGMMGPMGGGAGKRGVDKRAIDRQKIRKEAEEKVKKNEGFAIHDPYYSIVELTVYGQARFYNAPPPEPVAEPSQAADPAAAPADPNATPGAPPTTEAPKAEDASKKEEAPKAEDASKKEEAPKAEDAAKKEEAPKAEDAAKKEEAPKAEDAAKKDEIPQTESTPAKAAEPAKADSTAPQTP